MDCERRMFDTDRNGSINFDEFWYIPFPSSFIPISNPIPSSSAPNSY